MTPTNARHGTEARQSALAQLRIGSKEGLCRRCARILCSNAYGTATLGISARAARISFWYKAFKFITAHPVGRPPALLGYRYFSLTTRFNPFRISARARKARTFTKATDQPVSAAISFTERSS